MAEPCESSSSSDDDEPITTKDQARQWAKDRHISLATKLHRKMTKADYKMFKYQAKSYLSAGDLSRCVDVMDVYSRLDTKGKIQPGHYKPLCRILKGAGLKLLYNMVQQEEKRIQDVLKLGKPERRRSGEQTESIEECGKTSEGTSNVHQSLCDQRLHEIRALEHAARRGQADVVRLLLQHDLLLDVVRTALNGDAYGGETERLLRLVLKHDLSVDVLTTSLESWARPGNVEVVKLILHDFPVDVLSTALENAAREGNVAIVQALFERDFPVDVLNTALENAARQGSVVIVRTLLQCDFPVDVLKVALESAAREGRVEVARILLKDDPLKDVVITWLDSAVCGGQVELLLRLLLEYDLPQDVLNAALESAASEGKAEFVRLLLKNNFPEYAMSIGLAGAAEHGHTEVVQIISEYTDDVESSDSESSYLDSLDAYSSDSD